jgi:hypothetical protein
MDFNMTSSVGLPSGVEIRIVAEDEKEPTTGSIGQIWVREQLSLIKPVTNDLGAATQDIPRGDYLLALVMLVRLLNIIFAKTSEGT